MQSLCDSSATLRSLPGDTHTHEPRKRSRQTRRPTTVGTSRQYCSNSFTLGNGYEATEPTLPTPFVLHHGDYTSHMLSPGPGSVLGVPHVANVVRDD